MPKTVSEIYKEYKIMPSLQMHMLRTAAVASFICDNFTEEVNKDDIVLANLFHDMGNIIKSDLARFPEFVEPEGLEYWQSVKNEYISQYGEHEHKAAVQIMRDLGLSERMINLADQNQFSLLCEHKDSSDIEVKITHYSDGRVGPHGVMSYDGRMRDAKERYKDKAHGIGNENDWEFFANCGKEIEKQIFAKCKIKPEDITDEAVAPIIQKLRDFVIK